MEANQNKKEIGFVTRSNRYLIYLEGLPSVRLNSILSSRSGGRAIVASLDKSHIKAFLVDGTLAKAGDEFELEDEGILFPLGEHLFGRVLDTLGTVIDGGESLPNKNMTQLEFDVVADGIDTREEIKEQFETGITLVDALFPIGKGQRQLLFGPTSSGKTTFLRDTIINQKGKNIICVYVAIGKPATFVQRFAQSIFEKGAKDYSIIISALAEHPTPMHTIAPTAGFFIAEHFRREGREVLLVIDDLGTHAKYMRESALLMGRIPGRQSYPGDIFYQHAHLLERAGNFNKGVGGGSLTVLPVLETDMENFTDLIPTNVMATTDGHIFFSPALRAEGYYPSVAIDRSVTRVGRQTQRSLQQELSTKIMALFVEYKRQKEFIQFGTNVSANTKNIIKQGDIAYELLKQDSYQNISLPVQSALLSLTFTPFLLNREVSFLTNCKSAMTKALSEDPRLEEVRQSAIHAVSLNELLEKLNKYAHILEKACQP